MNEETFKVRAYGFGELAQLYFPNITKKSASAQMRKWISNAKKLIKNLEKNGYKSGNRLLTPVQVKILVDEFGEP
ncbi:MAG: hypothetical protein CFE21_10735 [Bacteroidetes bacterium B1(2017)]|nr:MAG: hypothetical protein CFE21_10735 [Bacteroidetes bacterium B1(2017)]